MTLFVYIILLLYIYMLCTYDLICAGGSRQILYYIIRLLLCRVPRLNLRVTTKVVMFYTNRTRIFILRYNILYMPNWTLPSFLITYNARLYFFFFFIDHYYYFFFFRTPLPIVFASFLPQTTIIYKYDMYAQ